jgi:tetratricopeptide (TPR) repeat protein
MKEETRLIYHCEYCKKISVQKSSMLQHEKSCKKNPNIKIMCFDCSFWSLLKEQKYIGYENDDYYKREDSFYFRLHFCKKHDIKMIPPKAFESEFLRNGLKDKYTKIMPTISNGCLDFNKAESVGRIFDDYKYNIELGKDSFSRMKYEEAIYFFNQAIEHSDNPEALYFRGNTKFDLEDYAGAIEDYIEAIKLNYVNQNMYNACISAYEMLNDYEGARQIREKMFNSFDSMINPYFKDNNGERENDLPF